MTRFLILAVMACLTSISLGGSTRSAVFSSADNKGSVPFLVTHGCSCHAVSFRVFGIAYTKIIIPVAHS